MRSHTAFRACLHAGGSLVFAWRRWLYIELALVRVVCVYMCVCVCVCVCCFNLVYVLLMVPAVRNNCVNPLKPSGHYMYRQFNIQQFHVLPTHCIYVFCVDLRTNSDYFPIQH